MRSVTLAKVSVSPTAPPGPVSCLVLAAGAATRFGARKQLAQLAGRPLLEHAVAAARAAPADRVIVVLGAGAEEIRRGVDLTGAEVTVCADWEVGLSASLRAGIEAAGAAQAVVVVLGDQPLIGAAAIERVLAARRAGIDAVRATYGGRPGHPVVLERSLFDTATTLRGDAGARRLLERAATAEVPCEDLADPLDVDSAADLLAAARRLGEGVR